MGRRQRSSRSPVAEGALVRVACATVVWSLVSAGCGSSPAPLPICEQAESILDARTIDGQPTIAGLTLQSHGGLCHLLSGCPAAGTGADASFGTPCGEVQVVAYGTATTCDLTFTSTDGSTFVASATVRTAAGTDFACTSNGMTITAFRTEFDPRIINVDFSNADGGDAGDADQ